MPDGSLKIQQEPWKSNMLLLETYGWPLVDFGRVCTKGAALYSMLFFSNNCLKPAKLALLLWDCREAWASDGGEDIGVGEEK